MTLVKTSILSAISTLVKILSGFILNKFIAIYAGPSGLAIIGQFQNFVTFVQTLSGDFLKTAVTKYYADSDTFEKQQRVLSNSLKVILLLSLIVSLGLVIFSDFWSQTLFLSSEYSDYIVTLGLVLPFFVLGSLVLSILNAERDIKTYIIIGILSSILLMLCVIVLLYFYKLSGGLYGYIIAPSLLFFIALYFIKDKSWLKTSYFQARIELNTQKKFLTFGLITFTSITSSTLTLIYVRTYLSDIFDHDEAGFWQAIWSISQLAQSLLITSLSTYLLPVLSSAKSQKIISQELKKGFMLLIPIVTFISLGIYFFREIIIQILYTKEFLQMENLFLWQMIGNIFKVAGWLIGYLVVAKAMIKTVMITEVLFALLFVSFTYMFCENFGLIGTTYSYALNSLLHFIVMTLIYFFYIKNNQKVLNA